MAAAANSWTSLTWPRRQAWWLDSSKNRSKYSSSEAQATVVPADSGDGLGNDRAPLGVGDARVGWLMVGLGVLGTAKRRPHRTQDRRCASEQLAPGGRAPDVFGSSPARGRHRWVCPAMVRRVWVSPGTSTNKIALGSSPRDMPEQLSSHDSLRQRPPPAASHSCYERFAPPRDRADSAGRGGRKDVAGLGPRG
jgi:hypothetical protein